MQPATIEPMRPSSSLGFSTERYLRPVGAPQIEFTIGDIVCESVDAIVNPAGPGLVDMAIHRAAGPALLDAFHAETALAFEGRLPAGRAVATPGFALRARHVIHVRPPVFADDPAQARKDLIGCHVEAIRLARARGWSSIAIPAIGTGVYRYPVAEAASVAVAAVEAELRASAKPLRVRFVFANQLTQAAYASRLA